MLTIAVLVTTKNRRDSLGKTLQLVQADDVDEIVVVDDGSTDGTAAYLHDLATSEKRLRIVEGPRTGIASARQAGTEAAASDVILFLDDDVRPRPGLVAGHRARHEGHPQRVVLGYMPTIAPEGRSLDEIPIEIYRRDYEIQVARYEADADEVLRNLWAGNFSMRRDDALRVGFIGADEFAYHEDQDFGFRCADSGLHGVFDRDLVAEHHPTRPFATFLRLAHGQGMDIIRLHRAYPDRCPIDIDQIDADLPRVARAVIRAGDVRVIGAVETRLLTLAARVLRGPVPLRAQVAAAIVARCIVQRRGYRDGLRSA